MNGFTHLLPLRKRGRPVSAVLQPVSVARCCAAPVV